MVQKKAPAKKSTVKSAPRKAVTKKPVAKKSTVHAKSPAKKQHIVKRILNFKVKGWVSKKGLFIGLGVLVLGAAAFTGYSLLQNSSANAGGKAWKSLGSVTASLYEKSGGKTTTRSATVKISVCKSGTGLKAKGEITSVKDATGVNVVMYMTPTYMAKSSWNGAYDGNKVAAAVGKVSSTTLDPVGAEATLNASVSVSKKGVNSGISKVLSTPFKGLSLCP